jgi:hypothetical protein
MSPGGGIWNSSRKRPELPPSSETATIADNRSIEGPSAAVPTYFFNPDNNVDKPVPPPIATRSSPSVSIFRISNSEFS